MYTFITTNGTKIPLEFNATFHTPLPTLDYFNLTEYIKYDNRFQWLQTVVKNMNGYNIEYCQVIIMPENHCKYSQERVLHQKYGGKMCYLTVVSSDNEPIYDEDLEINNPIYMKNGKNLRSVLLPEKLN